MKRTSSKIKPKVVNTPIHFEQRDCILDTPSFKATLQEHELTINNEAKEIKVIRKNLKNVIKSNQELSSNIQILYTSLQNYQYSHFDSASEDDDRINRSFLDYSIIFEEVERLRTDLINSLKTDLQRYEDTQKIKYDMLAGKKKRYEKELAKTEKAIEVFVKSSVQTDEMIRSTQLQRNVLQVSSVDYMMAINIVHSFNRLGFSEMMFAVFSQTKSFAQMMGETFRDQDDFLNQVHNSLKKITENDKLANQKILIEMAETNKNPYKSVDEMSVCGYLYVEEKANKKKLQFAAGVKRYFCEYNKNTCILQRHDVSENTFDKILVGLCRLSSSNTFAFDLFTESTPDFTTYIALTETEFINWCLFLGIPTDLNQCKNTEIKSQYTLDEHSLVFVKECIRIVETIEEGLNFVGLYRIEGSQQRKSTLLELGANPKTFDRFIKVINSSSNCQVDVSSCLKTYLRFIKPPLIHDKDLKILKLLIEKCNDDKDKIDFFTLVLTGNPPIKKNIIKMVFLHLKKVSNNHEINMMNLDNLVTCFAPSLIYFEIDNLEQLSQMPCTFKVIKFFIENCHLIFDELTGQRHNELNEKFRHFLQGHSIMK